MPAGRRILIALYTASGAAALVYEVVWTRILTLQLGHTVAAASTVLAAFMGGLAVGAWAAGRFLARQLPDPTDPTHPSDLTHPTHPPYLTIYAALEIAIAVAALLLPLGLHASVPALAWAYADGSAPIRFALVRVLISLTLVGLPAAAMGATFPFAVEWLRSAASAGALLALARPKLAPRRASEGWVICRGTGTGTTTGARPRHVRGHHLGLLRAGLRSLLDTFARAHHRTHDVRVCDNGGGVHRRTGD